MRFPLRPFDYVPHFDFMRFRLFWMWSSLLISLMALGLLAFQGLNYGIDFVGGKMLEVRVERPLPVADVRSAVDKAGFEGSMIQAFGSDNEFLIRLPGNAEHVQEASAEANVIAALKAVTPQAELRRVEFVGPQVGQELRVKGLMAMGVSVLAILIYVWMRFELRFGLGAILSLIHDVILTIGVMCLMRMEITLTVLAAILTLIGYSLNDTIVIFDRVRENRARYPNRPLIELLNLSVNQTLARTLMTVSTTLLVLVALFFWGGEVIHDFALVLIIGIVLGTYSSIFVASPTLLVLEQWYKRMAERDAMEAKAKK